MGFRTKAYKRRKSANREAIDGLTEDAFNKAKEALEKANVPEPYKVIIG